MIEKIKHFGLDAAIIILLFLPALGAWVGGFLVAFGVYDFELKNVKTQFKLFVESGAFERAVDERVGELRANDIYTMAKNDRK